MAYPFMPWPRFAAVKDRLITEFGCEYKQLPRDVMDGDGDSCAIWYFERRVGEKVLTWVATYEDETQTLAPSMIRHFCDRLGIDRAAFGLVCG